jgi:hypothetical protein
VQPPDRAHSVVHGARAAPTAAARCLWLRSAVVEPGPLPPHERAWRHPSELGPPPHEPTSTSGRVLIVTSAAVSLVLIGLLALAITPDHSPSPMAASSTVGTRSSRSAPAAIASSSALTTTALDVLPVVTPIGDDGWAVTTWEAVAGESGWMDARLPSGEVVEIEVIAADPSAGLVVVTLPASAKPDGYELAAAGPPAPSDTVFVNSKDPKVVTLHDLSYLDVEEGTPVLDDAGALIGLCTGDGHEGTALMTVDTMPGQQPPPGASSTTDVETTVPADDSTTTVDSTSPSTTTPDSSVADSTAVETTLEDSAPPTSEPAATSTTNAPTTER